MDLQKIIAKKLSNAVFMANVAQYVPVAGRTMFSADDPYTQSWQIQ